MKTMILPMLLPMILLIGIVFAGHDCDNEQTEPLTESQFESQTAETQQRTDFVFALFRAVVKDNASENITVSPYGAEQVLDLVRIGASGDTRAEIEQVLGRTETFQPIASSSDSPLTTAASLWAQEEFPILQEYSQTIREQFGATVGNVDFVGNLGEAVQQMNTWCSEKTNRKIPVLFDRLGETTRCVLAGAIYFAADWQTPFEKDATSDGTFTLTDGTTATAKIMSRTGPLRYGETDETLAVELPYKNEGYAMLLLLPRNPADFAKWETEMTLAKWNDIRKTMQEVRIDLRMPRFTAETSLVLNEPLKQLGMPTAFGNHADFSQINGQKDLYLSEVRQKAFVTVDETGTEAAAATGAVGSIKLLQSSKPFYADRPFLYAIVKEDTLLFLGHFVRPPVINSGLSGEGGSFD